MRKSLSFVVLSLFSLLFVASSHAASIFDLGSSWKYFVGTQEASTPQNAWRAINFNDSTWLSGAAPIGFGEGDVRSTVPTATLTVYHRKAFVVTNVSQITRLDITIRIDDGFVAWINGTEIGRYNVNAGDLPFNSAAPTAIEPESRVLTVANPGAILVAGTNVIAVHAINQSTTSSDIYMDASLATVSGETVAPTITSFTPTGGATLTNLTEVSVTFSEPVNGVNAGDLVVNGQPASSLTIGTNNTYVFSFVQPAYGAVQVSWATGHAIEDLAFPPNPFNATAPGATWQYTLQDRTAPTVAGTVPTPGFTVRSLTQVEITFSEPVRGVDAADLRINGTAAATVSSTDPSRYTFTFPQPAVGTVQVAWNGSHGISDLATPANNFVTSSGWSYVLNPNAALPDVIITEFLAAQAESKPPLTELRDEDGDAEDWIEIFNSGEIAVDLRGWSLTDSANNLRKWTFPQTNLAARSYMIIFASEKDRNTAGRQLHTNFKLGNNGEYLALVKPDGTIASQYAPSFPAQVADVSFGFPTLTTASNTITASSLASAFVPVDNSLALDWTSQIFNDGTWIKGTNGVGYETAGSPVPSLRSFIKTDVQSQMLGKNPGIFVRIPFVVTDAAKLSLLNLRLRYDDGVIGYINGREVLRVNAPSNEFNTPLFFNDRATAQRANNSTNLEDFDLSFVVRQGGIQTGTNILAFHVLNFAPDDSDALVNAELIGTTRDIQLMQTRYFPTPTPGADNGPGTAALGPVIFDEDHTPKAPQDNEDIFVTTRVSPTFSPVSQVTVTYRVMFGTEVTIPMLDDGQHSDGVANDGVFGATLPFSSLSTPGQMVRWFFRATDTQARSTRLPAFADPLNSAQYFGTIVFLAQTNNLPIFHWFMPNPEAAGTDACERGSIFYLDEFYDNVNANVHGQSSRGFPKHSYDIDFPGNVFKYQEGADRVDDINLLTTYPDKAKMRNMLSHATYRDAGGEYHYVVPIRIHTNGGFFGDWHIVENGDANFLKRLGRDPNGALYKMYNTFTDVSDYTISTAEAEKKTRKTEGNADIKALFDGMVAAAVATRTNFLFDNLNVPQMVNFLAAKVITADGDCCHKNYYFYRDTDGTGEWEAYPWDVDLSWGRQWNTADNYWNHNLVGVNNGINQGNNNGVLREIMTGNPQTQQMYLRRIRTIMDEQLGNTNSLNTNFEAQIAYWLKLIEPDATVDAQKWPFSITWGNAAGPGTVTSTCCTQTIAQAAAELTTNYLPARRRFMYNNLTTVPAAQSTNAAVDIRSIEHSPGNGNQAQEYIELVNTNTYAVDISGWKLAGGIKHTFPGGTVIPINGRLYVSPNVNAFRARASGPRGGLGLFVQGDYEGQLSARGEAVYLTNKLGRLVSTNSYIGTPSLAQQYLRVTEIMYHALPATAPFLLDDFDYIELKNIGPVPVPLAGVHFTNGIEFTFTALSAVTSLNPGQRIVLVKNAAAFVSRYGSSATIAGVYNGSLDNAGDLIKLDDALNDKILEFDYERDWYPITDGLGLSLVVVDENAHFDLWDSRTNWRPSADGGSPGAGDSPAVTSAPIVVNEVLTHTDLPAVDRIELFNPTASAVNIGGWYISDDFSTPKKFRIPANTMIAAGGYLTFSEANFNTPSNAPTSFSFGSTGDEAYIFSADAAGNLTAYYHGFDFGAAENGTSLGRYVTSVGLTQFVGQASQTFGASNSLPKVGPVVISEIMYHPPDAGGLDNSVEEYIELQNITTTNVALYNQTNGWELRDAVDFVFKANHSIPAGGYLVVVSFNPTNTAQLAAFRARYSIGTNVSIVGPYSGKLDNSDDSIELFRPDTADADGVPYILVERVHYYTTNNWDVLADGVGPSLHRKDVRAFGNDPINWVAAAPTGGGAFTPTAAPVITQHPRGIPVVAEGASTNLSVVATGAGLAYQWSFNGQTLSNAYAAVLPLTNLRLDQRGNYSVAVFNGGGLVISSNAFVNVRPAPSITQQPQNVRTNQGSNALFTVVASTTGTARYQWRFNGTNIVGATNSSLLLTNVQLDTHPGFYDVRVTDDIGSTLSQTNVFIVLVRPVITNSPPTSLIAVQGQNMTFSIVAGPDYPMLPLSIRWLRQGATYITNGPQTVVYTNLQANPTIVRVQVTNLAASVASPNINVTVLPDADGDGAPDDWEIATGFNPTNSADGVLDTDGDGMRNRDEFQAGTDPRDSNSVLRASISGNAGVVVQFMAQSSNYYVVQYRANFDSGQWQTLSNIIPQGAIRPVQIFDPAGTTGQRFYRIGVQLVP